MGDLCAHQKKHGKRNNSRSMIPGVSEPWKEENKIPKQSPRIQLSLLFQSRLIIQNFLRRLSVLM